jgi:hypothetical protein
MVNQSSVGRVARRRGTTGLTAAAAIFAVVALTAVSCGRDDFEKTSEGFNIEPPSEIGPHAFTASIVAEDTKKNAMGAGVPDGGEIAQAGQAGLCDTDKFVKELQARPEAYREWGRVLGVPQSEIPAFVKSLGSDVLKSDTKVTNHGLKNGKAYGRASVLPAGTAVLVDRSGGRRGATTTSPPATAPNGGVIVTRCKCGNPLLPPPSDPKTLDTESETEEPGTGTSEPGTVPGTTSPGTIARSATTSTSARSTTTATRGATTSGTT